MLVKKAIFGWKLILKSMADWVNSLRREGGFGGKFGGFFMKLEVWAGGRDGVFDLTPYCVGEIVLTSYKRGSASCLEFEAGRNIGGKFSFFEGDWIKFLVDEKVVFLGYVFSKRRNGEHFIRVTAYDQLRYFKNRNTYNYSFKTASQVVSMIASDFNLKLGEVDNSEYVIGSRIEENKTLFDIILNAVDLTFKNTGRYFVLFDKGGYLCFKSLDSLRLSDSLSVSYSNIIDFNCMTDIDKDTFSKIKLFQLNKKKKINRSFEIESEQGVKNFGVLQYFEKVPDEYNKFQIENYAQTILKEKNRVRRTFDIECLGMGKGEEIIRGGNSVFIDGLDIGEEIVSGFLTVVKCSHYFSAGRHIYHMWF